MEGRTSSSRKTTPSFWCRCWEFMQQHFASMVDSKGAHHRPAICYRPIRPSDLEVLRKIHDDLFPFSYDLEFYLEILYSPNMMAWGAVDRSRPNGESDELVGFVTVRVELAKDSEIGDLPMFDSLSNSLRQTVVYITTLGVAESYRNLGIATRLLQEAINYASSIPSCKAVYLHVLCYNNPALHLYQKMSFQCVRRVRGYYFIDGKFYDGFIFVYYFNESPSPSELVTLMLTCVRSGFKLVAAKLWRNGGKKVLGRANSKETRTAMQSQRIPID